MKKLLILFFSVIMAIAVLPSAVSAVYSVAEGKINVSGEAEAVYKPYKEATTKNSKSISEIQEQKLVKVLNPETAELSYLDIEDYIKGVVAAEMPALFHIEALKAQAVASRTYVVRKMAQNYDKKETETGQAYIDHEEMRLKWGEKFDSYYQKISTAVEQTKGEVLVYNNEPIEAVFHSTSAGITEDSANIWLNDRPYLVSVESKYDEKAPGFITESEFTQKEVVTKLLAKFADLTLSSKEIASQMQILDRTPAGYVNKIQIGNIVATGIEIREALGLRSSNFVIRQKQESIVFITKGYGHGAGMSQYGANFMADDGNTYIEILKHYYKNTVIEENYAGIDVQGW